jgi:hypothetical protein
MIDSRGRASDCDPVCGALTKNFNKCKSFGMISIKSAIVVCFQTERIPCSNCLLEGDGW